MNDDAHLPQECAADLSWLSIRNSLATTYDSLGSRYLEGTNDRWPILRLREFVALLPKEGLVLDLGCGPGREVAWMVRSGIQAIGMDISAQMLSLARTMVPVSRFVLGDMTELCIPPASAVGVWAWSSLQHVQRRHMARTLEGIRDCLVRGGILYINLREGTGERFEESGEYGVRISRFMARFEEEEFTGLLRASGFRVHRVERYEPRYRGVKAQEVPTKLLFAAWKP